ncbi:chain-length determining protein [Arthrobacter sp. D1-29]
MDPIAVVRTIWQHRIVSIPILVLTALAALYIFEFAPRSYESSSTFAMINPDIPSELDIIKHPELKDLNNKNPYLRSSDPSLIVQVLLTRLNDRSTADLLVEQGLSDQYTVSRGVGGLNGFLVDITGEGETPEKSIATTQALGQLLQEYLREAQKVNGADDLYLFSALVVATPDKAKEQFSSRLRALIVVFLCGVVTMFGSVSVARSMAAARERRLLLSDDAGGRRKRRKSAPDSSTVQEPPPTRGSMALTGQAQIDLGLDEPKTLDALPGHHLSGVKQ